MIPQQTIKLYLNGHYKIEEQDQVVATGQVVQDTGLRQLDAFLSTFRDAVSASDVGGAKGMELLLLRALREVTDIANANGKLLSIKINSALNPKANTLSYSFTLEVGDE